MRYSSTRPTGREVFISLGIWALGVLVFTLLAKVAIPIELGELRHPEAEAAPAAPLP